MREPRPCCPTAPASPRSRPVPPGFAQTAAHAPAAGGGDEAHRARGMRHPADCRNPTVFRWTRHFLRRQAWARLAAAWASDRKSVVSGKSVSVRVDLGGRRIIKKKKKKNVVEKVYTQLTIE